METASSLDPRTNHLLAALAPDEWQRLRPRLEWVDMPQGRVLHESRSGMSHVVFPTSAIVSLVVLTEDGGSAEIGIVGNEGVVGVELFLGGGSMPSRAVVRGAGQGFRLPAQTILDEFDRGGALMHRLLRYTEALITLTAQTAVCNRHHSLDQRLCRWLLQRLDRLPGCELATTQESIADMLGVRREGVTQSALRLQRLGLIRYARGHISALNRQGLERRACECYAVVRKEYDRLLPQAAQAA
jgi:CRP-like cAMP-binding protein